MKSLVGLPPEGANLVRYAFRLRAGLPETIREYMRLGLVEKSQQLIAAARELEDAIGWDGIPIDQEDFLGKGSAPLSSVDRLSPFDQSVLMVKAARTKEALDPKPWPLFTTW